MDFKGTLKSITDNIDRVALGCTSDERRIWLNRMDQLCVELNTVTVGIFMAGAELKTILKLHSVTTRTDGKEDAGPSDEELDVIENRIAEYRKSQEVVH